MTATEVLSDLERRGVRLEVTGDKLRWRPREAGGSEMLETLRERKEEILSVLQSRQRRTGYGLCPGPKFCVGCYEIGEGHRIHPPKATEAWAQWLEQWQPKGRMQ